MKDAFILQARNNTVSLLLLQDHIKALKHRTGFPVDFRPGIRNMIHETLRKLHLSAVAMEYMVRAIIWGDDDRLRQARDVLSRLFGYQQRFGFRNFDKIRNEPAAAIRTGNSTNFDRA